MLSVRVISPEAVIFEGEAMHLIAPGREGSLGILPGHSPLYAQLVRGTVFITNSQETVIPIVAGIMRVEANTVLILTGY